MVKCPKEAILKGDTMVLPTLAKTILTNSSTAVAMVDPNNSMVRRMMLIHLLGTTIEVRVTLYWAMRITLTITVVAPNTYTANSEPQGYGRSEDTQDYGSRRQQGSGYNEGYGGGDEPSSYSRRRNDDGEQPPARRYGAETYSSESRTDSYESSRYGQESSYVREESHSSRQQGYQPPQTESSTGYAPSYQPAYESSSERYSESRSSRTEGYEGGRGQEGPYGSQRTQGYESGAYRRPEEPSRYERREEESGGYGGHPTGRTEYNQEESRFDGRPSEGGGYGREDGGRPAYDESSRSYGRRQQEEERSGGGGNYGESEGRGYGGGYSGRDETFGAERLNISEGEEHPHHGKHHKKHHHQSDDY